ncbi:MAG: hypothetical protein R2717_03970 [Schumannella sp.]|nr:hypothetical protein [Microbacteriaceae bacterium]
MLSIAVLLAEHEEELAPLIMPPAAFAGIGIAVFVVLGFVAWSYRDVANRHSDKTSSADSHGAHH